MFPLATSCSFHRQPCIHETRREGLTLLPSLETPETAPWTDSLMYEAALETLSAMPPVVVVLVVADLHTGSVGYSRGGSGGGTDMMWVRVWEG